jgi:N-acyl-D-amino-acid deacylase
MSRRWSSTVCLFLTGLLVSCSAHPQYDIVIRHGTVYDGLGSPGRVADVAISGDRVVAVGTLGKPRAAIELDAKGLAVAPGFIDMLSHSERSLIADGRSQGAIGGRPGGRL